MIEHGTINLQMPSEGSATVGKDMENIVEAPWSNYVHSQDSDYYH